MEQHSPPNTSRRADGTIPHTDQERIAELVTSHHILYDHGVLDGFGHLSVRSAADPAHFFMQRGGVVPDDVTADDVIEYDDNGEPYRAGGRTGPSERYIHAGIYRARPDVMAVVHSHTDAVLPFGLTGAPLKAVLHTAYFLGSDPAPVFDIREAMGQDNTMLVDNPVAGAALARTLADRSMVLMRGHGMTVVGPTIHDAVFRAVYTRVNARAEIEALKLGDPVFLNGFEVDRGDPVSIHWAWWAAQSEARRASP
ncbi:class II aldolase/adducin family protein [Streptomyces sp. NPDC051576]|uniref:class II aldolase/adducin family protein n=1 Tax=Streptomyces sp. NPDC051576 TaxID=3155803 RepID=UPI00341B4BD5